MSNSTGFLQISLVGIHSCAVRCNVPFRRLALGVYRSVFNKDPQLIYSRVPNYFVHDKHIHTRQVCMQDALSPSVIGMHISQAITQVASASEIRKHLCSSGSGGSSFYLRQGNPVLFAACLWQMMIGICDV